MKKRVVIDAGKYVLAFALLAAVIWSNWGDPDTGKGLGYVWKRYVVEGYPVRYHNILLAYACLVPAVLLTFGRWYYLVRAAGLPFRPTDALRLGMIGLFFSTFLPGALGGDAVKAVFIAREQSRRAMAVSTVIVDRVIALWGLFWFVAVLGTIFWAAGLLAGELERELSAIVLCAVAVVAFSLVAWVVLGLVPAERGERWAQRLESRGKIGHALAEFWRSIFSVYRRQPRTIALATLIAVIGHVGYVLTFYFSVQVLWDGEQRIPSLLEHLLIVPIGMVIHSIPVLPGGVGIGEMGYSGLYNLLHCDMALGVLGSLVQRVIIYSVGFAGFLLYMRMRPAWKAAVKEVGSS